MGLSNGPAPCCMPQTALLGHLQPSTSSFPLQAGGLHRQGSRERLLRRGAGDSPTYGARPTSQPRSTSQPRTPSANPELVVNAPAVRKFLAQHQGELSGRTDQVGLELMCTLTDQPPHTSVCCPEVSGVHVMRMRRLMYHWCLPFASQGASRVAP